VIVELLVSAALLLGPPVAEGPAEGPADEGPADEGPADEEPNEVEAPDEAIAVIVEAAARAVQDRAVLERNNREVPEYVAQLDALAPVSDELDTCGQAVQAELRMNLALAYLRVAGTCSDGTEADEARSADQLQFPDECGAAPTASDCAASLLERAAAFGDAGPAGAEEPLAQAAGCAHAADSMSVEQMFGVCVAEQYEQAVDRWHASQVPEPELVELAPSSKFDVPRWGSILGLSLGVGVLAVGASLVAIDGRCPGGGDPMVDFADCPDIYNTNAGGVALISVGALAVLGMGTILVITELRNNKSSRRSAAMHRRMARVEAFTGWRAPSLQPRPRLRP